MMGWMAKSVSNIENRRACSKGFSENSLDERYLYSINFSIAKIGIAINEAKRTIGRDASDATVLSFSNLRM